MKEWGGDCWGRSLRLELNAKGMIQRITITTLGIQEGKCSDKRADFLDGKNWVTGVGLRIGDSQGRVVAFYRESNSSGPAAKKGRGLDLMVSQLDSARRYVLQGTG